MIADPLTIIYDRVIALVWTSIIIVYRFKFDNKIGLLGDSHRNIMPVIMMGTGILMLTKSSGSESVLALLHTVTAFLRV